MGRDGIGMAAFGIGNIEGAIFGVTDALRKVPADRSQLVAIESKAQDTRLSRHT